MVCGYSSAFQANLCWCLRLIIRIFSKEGSAPIWDPKCDFPPKKRVILGSCTICFYLFWTLFVEQFKIFLVKMFEWFFFSSNYFFKCLQKSFLSWNVDLSIWFIVCTQNILNSITYLILFKYFRDKVFAIWTKPFTKFLKRWSTKQF